MYRITNEVVNVDTDDIELYLGHLNLDHRVTNCLKAHKLLLQTGETTHLETFNIIQSYSDEYESDEFFNRLEDLLCEHLVDQVTEFGISVSNEKIHILTEILEVLYTLEDRDDKLIIKGLIEEMGEPIDIICDVLSHVTGRHVIEYLEVIATASPELIDRLEMLVEYDEAGEEMLHDYEEMETEVSNQIPVIRNLFKFLLTKITPVKFISLLDEGIHLGNSLDAYLIQIEDVEDWYTIEGYCNEYLAAYVASGGNLDRCQDMLSARLETLFDDMNSVATQMLRAITLINEFKVFSYANDQS